MRRFRPLTYLLIVLFVQSSSAMGSETQDRIDQDLAAGNPIVIHVSVALADNKHQWIVRVPAAIGNGQDARTNLYWGARYGLKTYLIRDGGWKKVSTIRPPDERILERIVLKSAFSRNGRKAPVYLVADAWDGRFIAETISQFLKYNAGGDTISFKLNGNTIAAGGSAHLIVYIGHNALMDYAGLRNNTTPTPAPNSSNPEKDAIVLACKSKPYFLPRLKETGASPLVLTTGLMAPEAYSLHNAIEKWMAGAPAVQVRKAAAAGYHKYQKTGRRAAERLFDVR